MSVRCLIVDDEPLARKLLISLVAKIEGLELVADCNNALEAGRVIRETAVDIVFLDIQMPDMTGLQFVKTLKHPPSIVFTTAYRDFAADAFDLDAVDYLIKPISLERFLIAVNKCFDRSKKLDGDTDVLQIKDDFVYFKSDRKTIKQAIADITYVESLDDYVKIHTLDKVWITREKISSLERALPAQLFVRIHRSFLINTQFLTAYSAESVFLDELELPLGRAFKRLALKLLANTK